MRLTGKTVAGIRVEAHDTVTVGRRRIRGAVVVESDGDVTWTIGQARQFRDALGKAITAAERSRC